MAATKHQPIVQELLDMIATNGWQDKFQQAFDKAKSYNAVEMDDLNALSLSVFNVFESVVLQDHKEASLYKGVLQDNGALVSMMSGSGPAVFGIFDDTEKADYAHHRLYDLGARSFVCTAR